MEGDIWRGVRHVIYVCDVICTGMVYIRCLVVGQTAPHLEKRAGGSRRDSKRNNFFSL